MADSKKYSAGGEGWFTLLSMFKWINDSIGLSTKKIGVNALEWRNKSKILCNSYCTVQLVIKQESMREGGEAKS